MAKKSKPAPAVQAPPPKPPPPPINFHGQPERQCGNCQHWGPELGVKEQQRVCHNGISQRTESHRRDSCLRGWYPSVGRFPIERVFNPGAGA